jgi:hypothetical protein
MCYRQIKIEVKMLGKNQNGTTYLTVRKKNLEIFAQTHSYFSILIPPPPPIAAFPFFD